MPMPAPPGGTMGVIFSVGASSLRSKNAATSGCSSIWLLRMFRNSALQGRTAAAPFSCLGFCRQVLPVVLDDAPSMPSPSGAFRAARAPIFSELHQLLQSSWACARPFERDASTISSVITPLEPQYSGSSAVALRPMRFVIILPSLRTFSRGASVQNL